MKKLTMFGLGGALTATALAGGIGVALAHGPIDGHHSGGTMMNGQAGMHMTTDPAEMDGHMQQMIGPEAYAAMRGAMGDEAFAGMLERMQASCDDMEGIMAGEAWSMPDHAAHHGDTGP